MYKGCDNDDNDDSDDNGRKTYMTVKDNIEEKEASPCTSCKFWFLS